MSQKLDYFNKKKIAEQIHHYLIQLPNVALDDNAKAPSIGYKVINQRYKFATLHGGNSYQSLILHVNPGDRKTSIGKELQKQIQKVLAFDIGTIRRHVLKTNEVYIPLEKLDFTNPIAGIEPLINYAYHRQDK